MSRARSIAVAAALSLALGGMQRQPLWGPNGDGTLDHADDARWVIFHGADITADGEKGLYRARFTPAVTKLDGKPVDIGGYMLPVEASARAAHFVLTRRSPGCPFCPPSEPTEAIEVFSDTPVEYTQSPILVSGRLHLVASSGMGLFYRLDHAKVN